MNPHNKKVDANPMYYTFPIMLLLPCILTLNIPFSFSIGGFL